MFNSGDRDVDLIVIHCSATPPAMDIGVQVIDKWHKENGWEECGYHFVIRRNGLVESGRDLTKTGAHAKGYNHNSIGLCLIGGVDNYHKPKNNYTHAQMQSLKFMLTELSREFKGALVVGHGDLPQANKDCPCFNVKNYCIEYGVGIGYFKGKS